MESVFVCIPFLTLERTGTRICSLESVKLTAPRLRLPGIDTGEACDSDEVEQQGHRKLKNGHHDSNNNRTEPAKPQLYTASHCALSSDVVHPWKDAPINRLCNERSIIPDAKQIRVLRFTDSQSP